MYVCMFLLTKGNGRNNNVGTICEVKLSMHIVWVCSMYMYIYHICTVRTVQVRITYVCMYECMFIWIYVYELMNLRLSIEPSIAVMYDLRIVDEVVGHITQRMRLRSPLRPGNWQLVRWEVRDFAGGEHDLAAPSFHLALVDRREAEVVVQMMGDYPLTSRLYVL